MNTSHHTSSFDLFFLLPWTWKSDVTVRRSVSITLKLHFWSQLGFEVLLKDTTEQWRAQNTHICLILSFSLSEIIQCQLTYTRGSAKLKRVCYLWSCPQAVSFVLQVPSQYLSLTSPLITNHNIYIFPLINFPRPLMKNNRLLWWSSLPSLQ